MDSLIAAAARALAAGDAIGALKRVALRDDPPALALRGIAMAQLGEHPRARELLRRAARGFGRHEELSRARDAWLPLARRPILFVLARALAEAWPADVDRNVLIERAFRTRRPDETHRARLRVEIGRLRALVKPLARIEATERGFALVAH